MTLMAKKPSGKPFPRLTNHNLTCIYCNGTQDLEQIIIASNRYNKTRFCYSCDECDMSLNIYKSKNGWLSVQDNSHRLKNNIKKGVNRINLLHKVL